MKKITHKPQPGDYFESYLESKKIDPESNLTWKEVYKKDLKQWDKQNKISNMKNKITFETLENYLQTIYEANRNGGIINIKESAIFVLNICNEIRQNMILESKTINPIIDNKKPFPGDSDFDDYYGR